MIQIAAFTDSDLHVAFFLLDTPIPRLHGPWNRSQIRHDLDTLNTETSEKLTHGGDNINYQTLCLYFYMWKVKLNGWFFQIPSPLLLIQCIVYIDIYLLEYIASG